MENNAPILPLIKEKLGIIILMGVLISALSFLFLVMNQKNFKATTDFLIVQNQSVGQDYYTLSKSAEFLGNVLGESIYSQLFIDEVLKTGKVDSEILPFDAKNRLKEWGKIVVVKKNLQLGTIKITVFANNSNEAINTSEAISEVLTKKNYLFRGHGQDIDVRIISGPILEKNPTFPDIFSGILGGFLVGAIATFGWLYYKEASFYQRSKRSFEKEYRESLKYLDESQS